MNCDIKLLMPRIVLKPIKEYIFLLNQYLNFGFLYDNFYTIFTNRLNIEGTYLMVKFYSGGVNNE
jgi:hypothetical protein